MSKTKAERAIKRAEGYLKEKLGEGYFIYDISALRYVKDEYAKNNFEDAVKVFKTLFETADEELLLALWNRCTYLLKELNIRLLKEYFTKEEYAFLKKVKQAVVFDDGRYGCYNINEDILTERLILRAANKRHNRIFKEELQKQGELLRYYMLERCPVTKEFLRRYDFSNSSLCFAVLLRDTEEMIGLVDIMAFFPSACHDGNISYCIFKDFRRKGYAKEAVGALINEAFQGKLYTNDGTPYYHVYKRKRVKLVLLRAGIEASNEPSKKTVKSLKFEYEGVVHRAFCDGKQIYDKENYYVTKDIWEKGDKR